MTPWAWTTPPPTSAWRPGPGASGTPPSPGASGTRVTGTWMAGRAYWQVTGLWVDEWVWVLSRCCEYWILWAWSSVKIFPEVAGSWVNLNQFKKALSYSVYEYLLSESLSGKSKSFVVLRGFLGLLPTNSGEDQIPNWPNTKSIIMFCPSWLRDLEVDRVDAL